MVVDFGGPGDVVNENIGYRLALTNERDLVSQIECVLSHLSEDQTLVDRLRQQGMSYAREYLSWDAKAQLVTAILEWSLRRGPKPDLHPRRRAGLDSSPE